MKKILEGQVFTLHQDADIIIDYEDEQTYCGKLCKIQKGTKFTIKNLDDDDWNKVHFEGYGMATFTIDELSKIV